MKMTVVAIRDRQADTFSRPFFQATPGLAVREFIDAVNKQENGNTLNTHPEDFELFHIADYDDSTGKFNNLPEHVSLAIASNVKR